MHGMDTKQEHWNRIVPTPKHRQISRSVSSIFQPSTPSSLSPRMTVFLPLEASAPFPQSPSFLLEATDPVEQRSKVLKAIMKAKRVVVICGAGISVQAGIPDFRSPEGLFQTLKRDNPREALASGKDLFDASVFNSEHTTSLFCQMIAQLSELSQAAKPTAFHRILRTLDDRGKLLRVYTQNIDAIEQKSGLSFGVPEFEDKRFKIRSKGKAVSTCDSENIPTCQDPLSETPQSTRLPTPPQETPRCIPLHGTLQMLHCQICNHSFPLEDYLPSLESGQPPQCPECTTLEETRQLVGKRARGIGRLRPSVVLYNEAHKDGEGVGEVVRRDLMGSSKGKGRSGADLLLVVGTSLRVPGTKRMVREFAKAVHSRGTAPSSMPSPTPSARRSSPGSDEEPSMKAVYLNLDFPVPTREWEGVFDAWIQGDAQQFAQMLQEEVAKETRAKELTDERRKKRDEELAESTMDSSKSEKTPQHKKGAKRKGGPDSCSGPAKRRRMTLPPTPPKTPATAKGKAGTRARAVCSEKPDSSRIMLRIPARPTRTYLVPEVYITSTPPTSTSGKKFSASSQPLPTPEKSPPAKTRHNPHTKAGRRAARLEARARSAAKRKACAIVEPSSDVTQEVSEDDDVDVLPDSFVRTVQYGLRGSDG